jgi:hypothetical protein
MASIQYTVRGVPPAVDAELRREARESNRTLNAVVVDTLAQAKLPAGAVHDDLDWFVGCASPDAHADATAAQAWLDALPADLP